MVRKSLATAAAMLIAGTFAGCSGADAAKAHEAAAKTIQAATETVQAMTDTLKGATVAKFDFGTPDSIVREGFTQVTAQDAFTPERGYGFQSTQGLLGFDRGGSGMTASADKHAAAVYGESRTTTDITSDLIEGTSENAFVIALPDGDYTVCAVAGDPEWESPVFEIWANGEKKLDVRIPRRAFVFEEKFQARATGGRLSIELKGPHGWVLNGLVVGKAGPELDAVVAKMHSDIFFLTDAEAPHWKQVKVLPSNPAMEWTPAEREKGYVLFPVDYTEEILPTDEPGRAAVLKAQAIYSPEKVMRFAPERAMVGQPVTAFATPGEFEPATFCLSTLNDLGSVAVELSDFVDAKSGAKIGRENASVGVVRCLPRRMSGWGGNGDYTIMPSSVEPLTGEMARVDAGQVKQYWLSVHVPEGTPAGEYQMSLTVRPEKAAASTVEWRLRVLPFQLARPADKHWGTWWDWFPPVGRLLGPERRGRVTPSEVERLTKADVADYGDHGYDLVIANYYFGVDENADGTFSYDVGALARDMEYFKALGKDVPVVAMYEYTCRNIEVEYADDNPHVPGHFSPKAHKAIVGLVQYMHDESVRLNWPKLYYFPIDEPGNNKTDNRMTFAENVLDFVHEVPGCETAATVGASELQRLGDRVDVRIYAFGSYSRDKAIKDSKNGKPFWFYENGMMYGRNTTVSRAVAGFEFLRSGSEVCTGWGFWSPVGNPYNDFDGGHTDWNIVFPGMDSPTPTIFWDLCREGVDDVRYVATLQEQIRLARERGQEAEAQRAEQVLAPVLDPSGPMVFDNSLEFGRLRWRIAREILNLTGKQEMALPFAAVITSAPTGEIGPNLIADPSFEAGPQADGFPGGAYVMGAPRAKSQVSPVGALKVTDEAAHSGTYSLKWDFSQAAGKGVLNEGKSSLVVTIPLSEDTVKSLSGKLVKVGLWYRPGGGSLVPGMTLHQYVDSIEVQGDVQDPAGWNHFEAQGRLRDDNKGLDISLSCPVPDDADVAAKSWFLIDDLSLQAYPEPPVTISCDLDEYYIGESIPWKARASEAGARVKIALMKGDEVVAEQTPTMAAQSLLGAFDSRGLTPGIYTLRASIAAAQGAAQFGERQIIVSPAPCSW